MITEIIQLIKYSPKRSVVFSKYKDELSPDSKGLKPLCPTRWTVRTEEITSVINNYEALEGVFMRLMPPAMMTMVEEQEECMHNWRDLKKILG